MIILKFIFLLGIIASCNVLAQELSSRMENGRKCEMNEAALLASLAYGPTPFCGGSFIASSWVLTAAHCCVLMELHSRFAIFGGQLSWRQDIEQTVKVGDLFVPEGYSLYPLGGDICVIKLAQPINPSAKVKISKLATTKEFEDLVQGKKCDNALTMGFGHLLYKRRGGGKRQATTGGTTGAAGTTGSGGTTAGGAAASVGTGTTVAGATAAGVTGTGTATGNMSVTDGGGGVTKAPSGGGIQESARCGSQQLLPREKCQGDPEIGKTITESIICMKDPKGQQQEPCQGDSGGPVYCGDLQIGVISVAIGCRDPKLPGYYTRVDMFKDYIDRVMSMQERSLFAVQEKNATGDGAPGGAGGSSGNATTKAPGGAAAKPSGGNSLGYSKILMFIPVIMRLAIF